MPYFDVRQQLRDLFQQTKSALESERIALLTAVKLIGELHASNPWTNVGISESEFMARLGISRDRYYSRVRAARALRWYPEVEKAFLDGKVALSTLGMIEAKLTQCNIEAVLKNIAGKTKREAVLFMSKVTADGEILERPGFVEIMVTLTEDELAAFNRLREVLCSNGHNPKNSEVLVRAVQDSLEKRDPLRKAQRAADRQKKKDEMTKSLRLTDQVGAVVVPVQQDLGVVDMERDCSKVVLVQQYPRSNWSGISAMVRHQVWLRDMGQCTHRLANGSRCDERAHLELDHIQMRCRGGGNEVGNIQSVCRKHNQFRAASVLGAQYMEDQRA